MSAVERLANKRSRGIQPYDVAFSLLSEDEATAQAVRNSLPPNVFSFLYTSAQREILLAKDGLEFFPSVFRQARCCVILHRSKWGETKWTRLEKNTIADRYLEEGSDFLVLVRLDEAPAPNWLPQTDMWIDLRAQDAGKAATYIVDRLRAVQSGRVRITANTAHRLPIPIARYQRQVRKVSVQSVPLDPEVCDGCTAAVQFRPYVTIMLPAEGSWPASREGFCPRCARKRGMNVGIPRGMSKEALFSWENPSFRDHVLRLLRHPVLAVLTNDAELRSLGTENVGAALGQGDPVLIVSGTWGQPREIRVPLSEMEANGIRSETELIGYCRARIGDDLAR